MYLREGKNARCRLGIEAWIGEKPRIRIGVNRGGGGGGGGGGEAGGRIGE